jgi:hypothetical protein
MPRVPLENWWTVTGQRPKWMRRRVEGSCRIRFLKVTVLSLRTMSSARQYQLQLDSRQFDDALSGWAGLTVEVGD